MATNYLDLLTMRSLYGTIRENPYEKKAKIMGQVMADSGLAKPLLAYAMGSEMAKAEEWDQNREAESLESLRSTQAYIKDMADREAATKIMEQIIKIAKEDPVAATAFLEAEAQGDNPYMRRLAGIKISSPITKEGWVTVQGGDGQAYQVYVPGLRDAEGDPELMRKVVIPIGNPKPTKDEPPKTRTVRRGNLEVTEEWDSKSGTWKEVGRGPAWKPDAPNEKEKRSTLYQEWLDAGGANSRWKTFEDYIDWVKGDPTKDMIREKFKNKKGAGSDGRAAKTPPPSSATPSAAPAPSDTYKSPYAVRMAYHSGKISKEEALKILKEKFGYY